MKNALCLALSFVLCVTMASCGSKPQNTNSQGQSPDVTTTSKSSSDTSSNEENETEVDPFDGLKVTFSGTVPDVEMSIIYKGKSRYVRQNIDFIVANQPDVLKRGEKVNIKAEYKPETPDSERITLLQTEKEFDVDGIDEYVSGEFDTSEIDAAFDEKLNNILHSTEYTQIGEERLGETFFKEPGNWSSYMIIDYNITPIKSCLEYVEQPQWDGEYHNRYIRTYKIKFKVEKTKEHDNYLDGRVVGEEYESYEFTYCLYADNVLQTNTGKITYDDIYMNNQYGDGDYDKDVFADLKQKDANEHRTMQIVFEKDI